MGQFYPSNVTTSLIAKTTLHLLSRFKYLPSLFQFSISSITMLIHQCNIIQIQHKPHYFIVAWLCYMSFITVAKNQNLMLHPHQRLIEIGKENHTTTWFEILNDTNSYQVIHQLISNDFPTRQKKILSFKTKQSR